MHLPQRAQNRAAAFYVLSASPPLAKRRPLCYDESTQNALCGMEHVILF
jgi:hypothetical protein